MSLPYETQLLYSSKNDDKKLPIQMISITKTDSGGVHSVRKQVNLPSKDLLPSGTLGALWAVIMQDTVVVFARVQGNIHLNKYDSILV